VIIIDNTIVSDDLVEVRFACNLRRCLGACCVAGDAGAPLSEQEIALLEDYIEDIRPFLSGRGRETVGKQGVFDYDMLGNFVTPLINDGECCYTGFDNGIAYCAIERAYERGVIPFRKPVSCHLYPVRITRYDNFEAVNYHKWGICKPALKKGKKDGTPLYIFLKNALVRKYGENWYARLEKAAQDKFAGKKTS
jgi:hypothetical protein